MKKEDMSNIEIAILKLLDPNISPLTTEEIEKCLLEGDELKEAIGVPLSVEIISPTLAGMSNKGWIRAVNATVTGDRKRCTVLYTDVYDKWQITDEGEKALLQM